MTQHDYDSAKSAILDHIQDLFDEMEQEIAMSHQEKYALLEDALENASDLDELKVAFEQWYSDHSDDIDFEYDEQELWDHAMANLED